jgi:hypothetical protein
VETNLQHQKMTKMEPQRGTFCSLFIFYNRIYFVLVFGKHVDNNFPCLNKKLYVRSAASGSKRSSDENQDDTNKVCRSDKF